MNINHENNDIVFRSNIAVEHKLKEDTYFLSNNSTSDFSLDMREFYLQMFTSWGEFKIGKIIHFHEFSFILNIKFSFDIFNYFCIYISSTHS